MFDPLVQAHAGAATQLDRVIALGDIIDLTTSFLTNFAGANRYTQAVQALQNAAVQDLNAAFPGTAAQIRQDIVATANGQVLAQKQVQLNVFYLVVVGANPVLAPIDTIINTHITNANNSKAFQDARLVVNRVNAVATLISQTAGGHSILLTSPPAPNNMAGKLQDSWDGGERVITVCNASNAAGRVHIVYLDDYDQNDIQGRTFQAGKGYPPGNTVPAKPIVTVRLTPAVGGGPTHATTLLHELGHALSSNGEHIQSPDNLMAAGAVRNGVNGLSPAQIGWYRNNPWVV